MFVLLRLEEKIERQNILAPAKVPQQLESL